MAHGVEPDHQLEVVNQPHCHRPEPELGHEAGGETFGFDQRQHEAEKQSRERDPEEGDLRRGDRGAPKLFLDRHMGDGPEERHHEGHKEPWRQAREPEGAAGGEEVERGHQERGKRELQCRLAAFEQERLKQDCK